jgi:hypothetical protein
MRFLSLSSAALPAVVMLMVACDTVDPGDCYPNTSGGFGGSGTIPIGAGVGVGSGDFASPRFGPLGIGGPANPCVTMDGNPAPAKGTSGASSGANGGVSSSDIHAAYDVLAQVGPQELAFDNAVAAYAASDLAYLVESNVSDPSASNQAAIDQAFMQYEAMADSDAQSWVQTVDISSVPQAGPFPTAPAECQDSPYLCPVGEYCPIGDGATCVLTGCGMGPCPTCPFWKNLVYMGYCTSECVQGAKRWGFGLRLVTRWGRGQFLCAPYTFKR